MKTRKFPKERRPQFLYTEKYCSDCSFFENEDAKSQGYCSLHKCYTHCSSKECSDFLENKDNDSWNGI